MSLDATHPTCCWCFFNRRDTAPIVYIAAALMKYDWPEGGLARGKKAGTEMYPVVSWTVLKNQPGEGKSPTFLSWHGSQIMHQQYHVSSCIRCLMHISFQWSRLSRMVRLVTACLSLRKALIF